MKPIYSILLYPTLLYYINVCMFCISINMYMVCFFLSFLESIYSHIDKIDGQDISFNIWDSLYPQVRH